MSSTSNPAQYISCTEELEHCCLQLDSKSALALDTEFVRTNTFYPNPGLIQIADDSTIYLIDPLAIEDLSAFSRLLDNEDITWVMHACSEDLVLLISEFGKLPTQIFDTQVAAAYLGYGFSLSYQAVVVEILSLHVDKDETRSDWTQRPLTDAQLHYAAADVEHLLPLYSLCHSKLIELGSLARLEEDMQHLMSSVSIMEDHSNWETMYADVSNAWRLSDHGLRLLQKLCVWREKEARNRNRPRNWIAKDNELFCIAQSFTGDTVVTKDALSDLKELPKGFLRKYSEKLENILNDESPHLRIDHQLLNPPLPPKYRSTLKAWRKVIVTKSEELDIAPELLARKRWLLDLIKRFENTGRMDWQPPLAGWRKEALQNDFEKILLP